MYLSYVFRFNEGILSSMTNYAVSVFLDLLENSTLF